MSSFELLQTCDTVGHRLLILKQLYKLLSVHIVQNLQTPTIIAIIMRENINAVQCQFITVNGILTLSPLC